MVGPLPSPLDIITTTPEKIIWNKLVNQVVNDYWTQKLITEAKSNVTLQYLSYEDFEMGKPHNIWKSCGSELKSQYQVKNSLWHIHFKLTVQSLVLGKQVRYVFSA
jgi:hypothetical protein